MIVYNHSRRWFTKKEDAAAWRRKIANPAPVIKIEIRDRDDLAALLNALCEPVIAGIGTDVPAANVGVTNELIDRAYVQTGRDIPDCIPKFLLKDWSVS